MAIKLSLLRVTSKAVLNAIGGGVLGELICEVLPEVAQKAWEDWSQEKGESQRRAEIEQLALASDDDVRKWVKDTVEEVAGTRPQAVKQQLTGYLQQVPASIRQNLRRPADPSGTTVPAGLPLRRASDLLALLPKRTPRFQPGDRPLSGVDLELVELLGVGGFGEVWKARNPHRPRAEPVALKFCLDDSAASALRNEVDVLDRVMSAGRHPGIVPLLHTYLSADPPCLELEYVEGGDLAGLIREWHLSGQRPSPHQAMKVICHLAEAVAFAHQQIPPIVHRDLKPANVLIHRDAEGKLHHRVSDFGLGALARGELDQTRRTGTSTQAGYTLLYASPEQMKGGRPATTDDVYALGVLWHQLLTGDLERGAPTGLGWVKDLRQLGMTEPQIELLGACIAPHAIDRPSSAVTLLERLDEVMDKRPDTPVSKPVREEKPVEMVPSSPHGEKMARRVLVGVLVGFCLLVVLLVAMRFVLATPSRPGPPDEHTAIKPGREVVNSLGMQLVRIEPGRFLMGSPEREAGRDESEGPQHEVEIRSAFFLGVYEVTQEEYQTLMGTLPHRFRGADGENEKRFPVGGISRKAAQEFCERLSERPEERRARRRYRLPTEAEWEYACRAGSRTPFASGDSLKGQANFDSLNGPLVVGSTPPNRWGLCDMHGNLREWVADSFKPYPGAPAPVQSGTVLRGGCFSDDGNRCRSAYRFLGDQETGREIYGFRVAMDVP